MNYIAPMTVFVTLSLVIGAVARQIVINRRMREIAHINAELQTKLLDRLTATGELQSYLASDAGKRFVESATVERSNPHGKILASVQSGILLFAFSIALQVSRFYVGDDARNFLHLFRTLGMVVGLGFLVSAFAVYTLAKRWGLIAGAKEPSEAPES